MRRTIAYLVASVLLLFTAYGFAADPITITVAKGERQAFQGFGTSVANWNNAYGKLTQPQRDEIAGAIWRDLKFNTIRLWIMAEDFAPTRGDKNLDVFRSQYIEPGIIADAKKFGVKNFLLAPDHLPAYMTNKTATHEKALADNEVENYAVLLADMIVELRRIGVPINVTGVQNEPSDEHHFTPQQLARVVKHLRKTLDARGLKDVQIIATENASANDVFAREVDALKADADAWKALAGIASHSYNMAANDEIAQKIAGPDGKSRKQYWMTEASENGKEDANDAFRAISISARFLNDMNHRVTHWIHFLGYEIENGRDDATTIIKYTVEPSVKVTKLLKYDAYKQLGRAFDVGCVFRDSTSSLEGDMTWTYGQKPRLTAAAGRNPDGTWSMGLANFTADSFLGVQGWADDKWNREQGGHTPAASMRVTIDVEELHDVDRMEFALSRTSAAAPGDAPAETAVMTRGRVSVDVGPMELITLRARTKN